MKKISLITLCFLCLSLIYGQEVNDTIQLDELVHTGQVSAQKINKSVYEVSVISSEQIEQSAAQNLGDLLNQTLNIQIIPNPSTGKSGTKLMGLNSQYVKVLVDNIPILNDEGLGSFTDLTQINLGDIEQIEIVEGAMGVEYGADAVAGIINIITKKSSRKKLSTKIYMQEESVSNEYNLFNRGKHIKGLDLKAKLTKDLTAGLNFMYSDFNGFYNNKKGKHHHKNDSLRGLDWLPKQQYDGKAFISYKLNSTRLYYKFNYFQEGLQRYNSDVLENYQPQTDTYHPTSKDMAFTTKRWYHLLNANGKAWQSGKYNISLSYQTQGRSVNLHTYDILNDVNIEEKEFDYESRKTLYTKALVEHSIIPNSWSWQLGAEVNQVDGVQSSYARGEVIGEAKNRSLGSYDFFTSTDFKINEQITLRPGFRTLLSSKFSPMFAYSLSASYLFGDNWELRANYGKSPKKPTYTQLYYELIDINHNIIPNENLKPEDGQSAFIYLKKKFNIANNAFIQSRLSLGYLTVKDKIGLIDISQEPLTIQFRNYNFYETRKISLSNQFKFNNFSGDLGINYSGEKYESNKRDMLYSLQGNLALNYYFPKAKLYVSTSFKYNGEEYRWRYNNKGEIVKGKQDAYSWWDASIRKTLFRDFELVLGVRNLTNVTEVKTSAASAGVHSAAASNILLGYGRSYFVKLTYDIPF